MPLKTHVLAAFLALLTAAPAFGITYEFSWEGDGGYRVEGVFTYDETTAPPVIVESGLGPTNDLESLTVEFFDPSDASIQVSDNVVNGESSYFFLTFEFDTATEQFLNFLDVGKDDGENGDTYLIFDEVGDSCTLFQVGSPGGTIDASSPCTITVRQQVSEPLVVPALGPWGLLILALALAGVAASRVSRIA